MVSIVLLSVFCACHLFDKMQSPYHSTIPNIPCDDGSAQWPITNLKGVCLHDALACKLGFDP